MNEKNILIVVNDDLCTGCGTCVALCPKKALYMQIDESIGTYKPCLDPEKCIGCGTCLKICPGNEVNFSELNAIMFNRNPNNSIIGNYLNCYLGHTKDESIRHSASSGGLITSLLIFALEEGIIDGALVTRMKKDNPLEPEPFIARTKDEILEAARSKYCPVPSNIALSTILESRNNEKFAIVGLPCHIHGIRKSQQINNKLREDIVLCFGIFCGHTPSFKSTKFLLKKIKINEEQIIDIRYRGDGWPGKVKIKLRDNSQLTLPYRHPYAWGCIFGSFFFIPSRCLLCIDGTCELSDISFADAWKLVENDQEGSSILVSRTPNGEELINKWVNSNKGHIIKIEENDVIYSQNAMLNFKKRNFKSRKTIFNLLNLHKVPNYNEAFEESKILSYIGALIYCLNVSFIQKLNIGIDALDKCPFSLFKMYNKLMIIISRFL